MSQETKHTPGPWKYQKQNGSPTTGQHMISGSKPGYLAEVRDCGSGDVEANSRLIAAAPELLELVKEFIKPFEQVCLCGREESCAVCSRPSSEFAVAAKARALVAKTEGKS